MPVGVARACKGQRKPPLVARGKKREPPARAEQAARANHPNRGVDNAREIGIFQNNMRRVGAEAVSA